MNAMEIHHKAGTAVTRCRGFGLPGSLWAGLLLVLAVLFLSTCPAGANDAGQSIRLGYIPGVTHAQALYARATGAFDRALGAPVTWVHLNAGPAAIEALFIDAVDAAFVGPGPTINGFIKSRGKKFVIVSGAASGGSGLVVRQDSGIRGERDFAGKVIATPQLGNTQDLAARAWFADRGYRLKEKGGNLTLVNLSNPDQLTMFRKRQIDGAWTIEPWLSRLEMEGGGRLLVDERALWPEGRYVTTHLVVNRQYLARNPQLVKRLLAELVAVTNRINADKAAAARIINRQLKNDTGKALWPNVLLHALERVTLTWDPVASSLRKNAEYAYRAGFLKKTTGLAGIYSLDLLNSVLREQDLPEINDATQ